MNEIISQTGIKSFPFSSDMSSLSCTWALSDDAVIPVLPLLYPLEKTHVFITNTAPSLVVSRISECLKHLSISITLSAEQITAVKAETYDHVTFNIQLFSKLREGKEAVIVEVQRSSGCPMSFHRSCQSILRAARGLSYDKNNKRFPIKCQSALLPPPKRQRTPQKGEAREKIQSSIEIARSLLKKDRFDANLLGMQSLRMLTDPETCGYEAATTVANAVLTGDEDYEDIPKMIKSLIKFWRLCEYDLEEEEDEFDHKHYCHMHSHALAILSNSLKLSAHCGSLSKILDEFCWLSDDLISLLLEEMRCTSTRPYDAFLATRCLTVLVETSDTARSRAIERGAERALKKSLVNVHMKC